jgi:hypothetical protein
MNGYLFKCSQSLWLRSTGKGGKKGPRIRSKGLSLETVVQSQGENVDKMRRS